jgi:DNA (cytosine-5)-methyltransferase 1
VVNIGSLFSGYGGLDMGVMDAIGGEVAWHVEYDKAPSKILAHHWPDIPNYGDITTVDWSNVPPVDVLTGGFPCQDVSLAGRRAGLTSGTRSGLWSEYARAIDVLKPKLVVIENVRGLLSAAAYGAMEPDPWGVGNGATRPVVNALGVVLGDLASLGYDARWLGLRAANAGAPHGRYRVFIVAYPESERQLYGNPLDKWAPSRKVNIPGNTSDVAGRTTGTQAPSHPNNKLGQRGGSTRGGRIKSPNGDRTIAAHASGERLGQYPGEPSAEETWTPNSDLADGTGQLRPDSDWGPYLAAIKRWEVVTGRVAPPRTAPTGKKNNQRLSSVFVEWMMGLPNAHVTAPEIGLSYNEQLKALGNGVVPQQASLALRTLLTA